MGFDVEKIKSDNPIRSYIGMLLGKRKNGGADYDAYKCPLHGETKGASLVVYDDHWQCYGKCGRGGDVISFCELYYGMSFEEACKALGGDDTTSHTPRPAPTPVIKPVIEDMPPSDDWQSSASKLVDMAQDTLWSKAGSKALDYLRYYRYLNDETIRGAKLGYVKGNWDEWVRPIPNWEHDGKVVPVACGITIPHFADGSLWGVRVRRAWGDVKYVGVRGGRKTLYGVDGIEMGKPVLMYEGEFDALVTQNLWRYGLVSPVALCGASNTAMDRWIPKLLTVPKIYARMDADGAGMKALQRLMAMSDCVTSVQVPSEKDATDYVDAHGLYALLQWIKGITANESVPTN